MVLPPIETTPVTLMRFTSKAKPELIKLVKERLCEEGLIIAQEERTVDDNVILGLTTTQAELEAEAEHVRLLKKTNEQQSILDYFTISERDRFVDHDCEEERDRFGLFGFNDWALLVRAILDSINVVPEGQTSSHLSRMLDREHVPYLHHTEPTFTLYMGSTRRLFYREEDEDKNAKIKQNERSESIRQVLEENEFLDVVAPTDIPILRDRVLKESIIWRHILKLQWTCVLPDPETIREYYGEEVAFYFAWMNHFTLWLCFPGIIGFFTYIVRWYREDSIDEDEYTPFYGLITFVWAVLFARYWDREENRLAYKWGTFSFGGLSASKFSEIRPEFEGVLRPSPVTGAMELYYPPHYRMFKYVVSAFVTLIMLAIAFIVMIMSLNVQGYINPKHDEQRWGEEDSHPFHFEILADLAEEGHLFDINSWRGSIPCILHVVCIMTLNTTYRQVAERLTQWENHETVHSFNNSLILKRFLFEAFDCYIALFYLAFYEHDMEKLRGELVNIFNIDTFRRLAVETILPAAMKRFSKEDKAVEINRVAQRKSLLQKKKFDAVTKDVDDTGIDLTAFANQDQYEQFDDYLEMVLELGYVCIFASAYPLASLIAIFANLIEMRSDLFKITHLCRRPRSMRANGIGMWKTLVRAIIWLSAITNCFIFGFTSQQLAQWLPSYYYQDDLGHHRLVPGKGWVVVFFIFGLERVLLYVALLIDKTIAEIPEDVIVKLARRQYIIRKREKNLSEELKKGRDERMKSVLLDK